MFIRHWTVELISEGKKITTSTRNSDKSGVYAYIMRLFGEDTQIIRIREKPKFGYIGTDDSCVDFKFPCQEKKCHYLLMNI